MAAFTKENSGLTLVDGRRGKDLLICGRRLPAVDVSDDGVVVTVQIPSKWVAGATEPGA